MYNYLKQKTEQQMNTDRFTEAQKTANRKGKRDKKIRFKGEYKSLKVIPKSKRTDENSNSSGVAKG